MWLKRKPPHLMVNIPPIEMVNLGMVYGMVSTTWITKAEEPSVKVAEYPRCSTYGLPGYTPLTMPWIAVSFLSTPGPESKILKRQEVHAQMAIRMVNVTVKPVFDQNICSVSGFWDKPYLGIFPCFGLKMRSKMHLLDYVLLVIGQFWLDCWRMMVKRLCKWLLQAQRELGRLKEQLENSAFANMCLQVWRVV